MGSPLLSATVPEIPSKISPLASWHETKTNRTTNAASGSFKLMRINDLARFLHQSVSPSNCSSLLVIWIKVQQPLILGGEFGSASGNENPAYSRMLAEVLCRALDVAQQA